MQKLNLHQKNDLASADKPFWRRQFQKEGTKKQKAFDWIFGVILPVICFSADPAIFRNGIAGEAFLGTIKPFAYLLSFVSIMAMMAWLIWGDRLKWVSGFLAGLFIVGGLVSFVIGLVLLPVSIVGLIILIGALGFTPLLTSIVYLRNAYRSYHSATQHFESGLLFRTIILTGMFSVITPAVINMEVERAADRIKNGNSAAIMRNAKFLYLISPIINADFLKTEYRNETIPERKIAIANAYKSITGQDLTTVEFGAD